MSLPFPSSSPVVIGLIRPFTSFGIMARTIYSQAANVLAQISLSRTLISQVGSHSLNGIRGIHHVDGGSEGKTRSHYGMHVSVQ